MPCVLFTAGMVLVAAAPAERMLGAGARWVNQHVGLVWAEPLAPALAAMMGAATTTLWATLALRPDAVTAREP